GCWEVKCKNEWTKDFYGEHYDRTNACYNESASVIVRTVDRCRCVYPPSSISTSIPKLRSAEADKDKALLILTLAHGAGDLDHLDLSKWAFEKLAELRWGVIALRYRPVPCDYVPAQKASSHYFRRTRDWPELRSQQIVPRTIFNNGRLQNGFTDVSWSAWMHPLEETKQMGILQGPGICATIQGRGVFALKTDVKGIFDKTVAFEFWLYVGKNGWSENASLPDVAGGCSPVRNLVLKPIMFQPNQPNCLPLCNDYWWGYRVYLPTFAGAAADTVINDPKWFNGCGDNEVRDLHTVEFRSLPWDVNSTKFFCLDRLHLV
ncbi:hypothetical protein DUNSADRAFT_18741, partial [Dunaliella salina]